MVVNFHWGNEYDYEADEYQRELAHKAIDMGADLIIGHHPHVVQEIEYYKGKAIVYSLGNFIFGGNTNPSVREAIIYQIAIHRDRSYCDKVIPIFISSSPQKGQGFNSSLIAILHDYSSSPLHNSL